MAVDLRKREAELLTSLSSLESEVSRYTQELDLAISKLDALKQDLNGIRIQILNKFLTDNLTTRNLTYTLDVKSNGDINVAISAQSGGELEFDKMRTALNWPDMNAIPLFYIFNYIGKGMPWGSQESSVYAN